MLVPLGGCLGSRMFYCSILSLLFGDGVRRLANEGKEMADGPGLGTRVAGMALEVRKTSLDAASAFPRADRKKTSKKGAHTHAAAAAGIASSQA